MKASLFYSWLFTPLEFNDPNPTILFVTSYAVDGISKAEIGLPWIA